MKGETVFATELQKALTKSGLNLTQTADAAGLSRETVSNVLRGIHDITPRTAAKLAVALDAPQLVTIVRQVRRRACENCGHRFVSNHNSGTRRRFCTVACQQRAAAKRRYNGGATERLNTYRVKALLKAIEAFCHRCEWDGICKDQECELRRFSPLPLQAPKERAA